MNIFYLVSVLLLFTTAMLIKKVEKKINFISSFIMAIIAFLCYQTILAYFLDLVRIPISLLTMGIINILVSIILWSIILLKGKQIQKYTIKKQDILFLGIMLVINIPILYKEFGMLHNFRYISTDSVMHCQAAITFSKSDFLLDSMTNWEAVNPTFMIAGYVNSGILMKALVGFIGEFNLYKVYMFMDILYYFMIGYIFYMLISSSERCNTKLKYGLAYIISILFMLGYPLNSVITGFHYFTLGMLELIAIIYVIKRIYKQNEKTANILLFLLNTAIMLTYNLFAPILYLSEFIYFIYQTKQNKEKIISKKFIGKLVILLIIPGIIGVSFFILPRILENIVLDNQQQLWIDGYIYINYWSNMVIFVPVAIYYIIEKAKEGTLNIEIITFFTICFFTLLFFLGLTLGYVSTYYFMKLYYIFNIILLVLFYKGLCRIIDANKTGKIVATCLVIIYCILLLLNLIFVNVGAYDFQTYHESGKTIFDIYNSNKAVMKYIQESFTDDRMDALEYIYDNSLIEGQNLLYLGDYIDNFLFKMFFTYENREGIDRKNIEEHIQKWNHGEYEYLVVFLKEIYLPYYTNVLELRNSKIVFESTNCIIYQYEN